MTTERYEQIGWTTPEQDDIALMDGEGCEVGTYWTVPVYVKVTEPERCPTCGSDDPTLRYFTGASGGPETGFAAEPCPDSWHTEGEQP